jgi:DNA polymerase
VWQQDLDDYFEQVKGYYGRNLERATVVIQNAKFDALVLVKEYGIKPKYVIDIKDLDSHIDSRRSHKLRDIAKRLHCELPEKGDMMQFKGLHLADMNEIQRYNMEEYCKNDIVLTDASFDKLMPYLSDPVIELNHAMHTLNLYLYPRLSFDFELAEELTLAMTEFIDTAAESVGMTQKDVSGNLSFVEELIRRLPEGETVPIKPAKRPGKKMTALLGVPGMGPALAKEDDGCKWLLAHPSPDVSLLMEARQAVKSWPLHVKRIANMKRLAIAADGRLPVPLNYYGCHTGRPSGGGGINLLNLGGSGRAGMGTHPLITKMRQLLTAGESKFVISDAAQIEARLLAWIAGQSDLVQEFAEGQDVYSEFGQKLFNAKLRKAKKTDPPALSRLYTIRRGFSKDTILGSGYGMGPDKFYKRCLQNPSLRPLFDSGEYDIEFVKMLINGYRRTYYMIPKFWKTVESCFRIVTRYRSEVRRYAVPGTKLGENDLLTFWNYNGCVCIQLPSGRILYYPHASCKDKQIKYHHGPLWGGSITENIIQSIARDLLVYWMNKCEEAGMAVVLHIYDEIIAITSSLLADEGLKTLMAIMSEGPEWAAGLPLAAEGQIAKTYVK